MIMKNDFSFVNDEQKEQGNKDYNLKEEDVARMQMVKAMHGPMSDSLVEAKSI